MGEMKIKGFYRIVFTMVVILVELMRFELTTSAVRLQKSVISGLIVDIAAHRYIN
jgi:hypothetical protein